MKKALLKILAVIYTATSLISTSAHANDDKADFNSDIQQLLQEEGLTGISWVLVTPENGIVVDSAGYANSATKSSFTTNMKFHVGSVTKAVVATGVLHLASDGAFNLDDPIKNYLPDVQIENPWSQTLPVTIRHLLDHTSGIEDGRFWQFFSEKPEANTPLSDSLPTGPLEIRTKPGQRHSYSNTGYAILGMLIEMVRGQEYEEYLKHNLLTPLGMNNSTFSFTTQMGVNATPDLVWGHFDDGTPNQDHPMYLQPAGQFTTTTGDLGRFAQFLLGDGKLADGSQFIEPSMMRSRGKLTTTDAAKHGLEAIYSLGLARRDRHSVVGFCHTGSIIGFYAILCIYPDEEKAFAFSINTDSEVADYGRITDRVIKELSLANVPVTNTIALPQAYKDDLSFYKLSPNRFEIFNYLDTVAGLRLVHADDTQMNLTISSLQSPTRQLQAVGGDLFKATDRSTTSHVFYDGENGARFLSTGFQTYEKTSVGFAAFHGLVLSIGLMGFFILFMGGILSLLTKRGKFFKQPIFPAFLGIVSLGLPIPLFFFQSFLALGDLTAASFLLTLVTALLPIALIATLYLVRKTGVKNWRTKTINISALSLLIWWLTMASYGQVPLMLWS